MQIKIREKVEHNMLKQFFIAYQQQMIFDMLFNHRLFSRRVSPLKQLNDFYISIEVYRSDASYHRLVLELQWATLYSPHVAIANLLQGTISCITFCNYLF